MGWQKVEYCQKHKLWIAISLSNMIRAANNVLKLRTFPQWASTGFYFSPLTVFFGRIQFCRIHLLIGP